MSLTSLQMAETIRRKLKISKFMLSFSVFFLFISFLLSFCSEYTGPLDLNYSGLFFREIANKQIGDF